MNKHYFFFDIDGTLTDDATHLIVPSAADALNRLQENGNFIAIATGRVHYKAKTFTDSIGVHNIVCSGGGCLVSNDRILENRSLDHDKCIALLENADSHHIGWILILDDSDKVYMRDYRFLEQAGLRTELTTYKFEPDMDYHDLSNIYKIYLAISPEDEKRYDWLNTIAFLRMGKNYCVFQYDEKNIGIERMMHLLEAPIEDAVIFGDGKNDLVMFDPRWTSIAMGNGIPALKEKADYVTTANVNDGIINACRHFGWL